MKYLKALITRINSFIHCSYVKLLHFNNFSFHIEELIANSTHFIIEDQGQIHIGKKCGFRRFCELRAIDQGKIDIGDKVFMNNGCIVVSHESITIGDGSRFGPNVMIFDHDYYYNNTKQEVRKKHRTSSIVIGKNVWLGAGVIVLRGTMIGDNCIIGAGAVVKGKFEPGTIIIQKASLEIKNIEYNKRTN